MALTPTGPRNPGPGGPGSANTPANRNRIPASRPPVAAPAPTATRSRPQPGRRLKTATTDDDVERQIVRLMSLIANDNIDPDAPPGSYLNLLI